MIRYVFGLVWTFSETFGFELGCLAPYVLGKSLGATKIKRLK